MPRLTGIEFQSPIGDSLIIDSGHTDMVGMAVSNARNNASVCRCPTGESGRDSVNMSA
jgi:hypothetical protein